MPSLLVWLAACGSAPDTGGSADPCTTAFYLDGDDDGHGDATVWTTACDAPSGYVAAADDCDDTNAAAHPGAPEVCDGVDDDCDGAIDAGAVDAVTRYADVDADGFGDEAFTGCSIPDGFVAVDGDCDDHDAAVHPDVVELCNDIDDDCDGLVDALDDGLVGGETWFSDADGDHYGDPTSGIVACDHPKGRVDDDHDCDDADAAIRPGAAEWCDGIDNDCDALVDDADPDEPEGGTVFYLDSDGDGLGDDAPQQIACAQPLGWAANHDDCDDADASVGAAIPFYTDADYDGFGRIGAAAEIACGSHRAVATTGDCDDLEWTVHPDAPELCDFIDNNCDGTIDDDDPLVESPTWYRDVDDDGYGDDLDSVETCEAPDGYVASGGDCDDGDVYVHAVAPEYCDAKDNDCDGAVDETVVYADWFPDADGDGYGVDDEDVRDCAPSSGYVAAPGDCDDADPAVSPGSREICGNGIDDDCGGLTDDCVVDLEGTDLVIEGDTDCASDGGIGRNMAVGDFDGDGMADLLLAITCYGVGGRGSLVYGPASGTVEIADAVAITTPLADIELGATIAAGDLDGDGIDDVVLGAPDGEGVFAFLGPITADRATPTADAVLTHDEVGSLGYDLDIAGDFSGDGVPDLIVGAPRVGCDYPDPICGFTYVSSASATGAIDLSTDASYVYYGPNYYDDVGEAFGDAGDHNGDGVTDLAFVVDTSTVDEVIVIDGGALAGTYDALDAASASIETSQWAQWYDAALRGADVDGDGHADLLLGAPEANDDDRGYPQGAAYLFLGPLSGDMMGTDATATWWGPTESGQFGASLASDDIDADGELEILFGAPNESHGGEYYLGSAFLHVGKAAGVIEARDLGWFPGWAEREHFGQSVGFVPDWTGDGKPEIAIGSPFWDYSTGRWYGRAYVGFSEGVFE